MAQKHISHSLVKPRLIVTKIEPTKSSPAHTWVIAKSKEPGPGSYKVEEAIKKGTWAAVKGPYKGTDKKKSVFDEYKERYKYIPGAGKYKDDDKVHKYVHKDPNFKMVRH